MTPPDWLVRASERNGLDVGAWVRLGGPATWRTQLPGGAVLDVHCRDNGAPFRAEVGHLTSGSQATFGLPTPIDRAIDALIAGWRAASVVLDGGP